MIGYVDANGATGPEAVLELMRTSATRIAWWLALAAGRVLLKAQPKFRQIISRCFHLIVELLFWMHIKDTQCPCKLMRRGRGKNPSSLRIADLAFDVNLLVAMKHAGFRMLEVPIEWTDMVGSKVTAALFRQSLTMFLSVVRIRLIYSPFTLAAAVASAGRLGLQNIAPAATAARPAEKKNEDRGWKMEAGDDSAHLLSSIFNLRFSLRQVNHAQAASSSRLKMPSVLSTVNQAVVELRQRAKP